MQIDKAEIVLSHVDFVSTATAVIMTGLQANAGNPTTIGLSGGNTPLPVYRQLGERLHGAVLAEHFYFIQVDERNVAHNSPRSNQRAILNNLFNQSGLPLKQFSMIRPGNHDFENTFNAVLPGLPAALMPPRPIDMLILGMGSDGHTASLFPDVDWQNSHSRTGYRTFSPKGQPEQRVSLTLERILGAGQVIFLVSGTDKTRALTEALLHGNLELPAGYIAAQRPTTWVLAPETFEAWNELKNR